METQQIVVIGAGIAGALFMYITGYFMASRKKNAAIAELTEDFELDIGSMQRENDSLKQQLNRSVHGHNETHRAYVSLKNDYIRFREFFNKIKHNNASLSMNYAKLQQEYTRINYDRASLHKKMDSYRKITIPTSQEYQKTKQELAEMQSTLQQQQQDYESIRQSQTKLTEDKKKLFTKLQKVYSAYKNISTKANILQKKADETDTVRSEKDTISMKYKEALDDLMRLSDQNEQLETLQNERNNLATHIEKLQSQVDKIESLRRENTMLREQNIELASFQEKVSSLESDNAILRTQNIVIEKPARFQRTPTFNCLGKSLEEIIYQLAELEGCRGAVFADNLGLAVAGSGDNVDSLAGMAAVFTKVEERIHSLFSFGSMQKLIMSDDNQLTLTAYPFPLPDDNLVLTTLSVGSGPDMQQVRELMKQVNA